MRNILKILIVFFSIAIVGMGGYFVYDRVLKKEDKPVIVKPTVQEPSKNQEQVDVMSNNFNYNLILNNHAITEKNKNYLISPYSIEIALNMLRDGASGKTKDEIDKVIGERKINDVSIKDKVEVANSIFMNNTYEKFILKNYKNNLKNNYDAELYTYKFNELVDKINIWVNDKTKGMINKIINSDDVDEDYVLGLVNALAIDIDWQNGFECINTKSEEFSKVDGSKINVEMMHKNGYQYIKEENVEGIILPYKKEENSNVELEFIGLIPTVNLDYYINNNLEKDMKSLTNLIKTPINNEQKEQIVNISLPRFTYDYEIKKDSDNELFTHLLENMGIRNAFISASYYGDKSAAEFENMADIRSMIKEYSDTTGLYVSKSIHKTHIELMEKGTKASAVTYFGISKANSALPIIKEKEYIDIKFNKPFIYIIREKNTEEMLFFGVVYEPNLWNGNTCNNKK